MRLGDLARRAAPAAVLLVLAIVLFAPATLGGKVLSASDIPRFEAPFLDQPAGARPQNGLQFDAANVFEPDALRVRAALRDGRLPLWAPWMSAGRPLLAAQQSAPLYPLTWIGVVFGFWEALAWIAVLKLALAGLGTLLLARALGLRTWAALVGGITFAFGSYLVDWLMHPHANAYVVVPWLFLLALRLCRMRRVRDAGALAGVWGIAWLSGQPESALLVSLATAAWLVYLIASRPRRDAVRVAALAAGAAALGVALGAVMLLPLREALDAASSTSRSGPPLPLKSLVSLFFPEFWGRPDKIGVPGPSNFTERTFYVGAVPLLLAVAGLAARRPRGPQLFFAGLAVAAVAVSLDTPVVAKLAAGAPVLDAINVTRALALASFGLAMLAAFGLERLLAGTPRERRRMLAAAAATTVLPVLAVVVAHPGWLDDLPAAAKRVLGVDTRPSAEVIALASVLRWSALAAIGCAAIAAIAAARVPRKPLAVAAIAAVAALDLLVMGSGYNPAIPKAQAAPAAPPPVAVMRRLTAGGGRVVGIDALEPNTASRWGLSDARGHEQPPVARTNALWYALGGASTASTEAVSPRDARTPKLLDLFGVRAVLLPPSALRGSRLAGAPALARDDVAYAGRDGVVLDHRSALPAAFVAYRWRRSPSVAASMFAVAAGTAAQALDEPVIETGAAPASGGTPPATRARVRSRSDTEVTLDVRARARGQLVLLDAFYPGWRAEVDGRAVDIHAANGAFRAVAVGPGAHEVRFFYRPASVVAGGAISIAALIAVILALAFGAGVRGRRRRRAEALPAGVGSTDAAPRTTAAARSR